MDTFGNDFLSVWTVGGVSVAVLGGVLGGLVLAQPQKPLLTWRLASIRTIVTVAFLGFLGTLYYAGRTGEALVEQDGHLGRLIGAWFLWLVFCLGVGVGILLDHWWNTRHPKPPTTPGEPTETP
jgi:hypothetical protein